MKKSNTFLELLGERLSAVLEAWNYSILESREKTATCFDQKVG